MKNILLLLLLPLAVNAQNLNCALNYAPPGMTLKGDILEKYARTFQFSSKQKEGKKVELDGDKLLIWNKKELIHVQFIDSKSQVKFQTSFVPEREKFSISFGGNRGFECYQTEAPKKYSKDDLEGLGGNVSLIFKEDLTFKYFQQNVRERMRPILFQKGELLTNDDPRDKNLDYCILEAQLKLDENITVSKGTKWPVMRMDKLDNSERDYVYSYSFVDIARGKKMIETFDYVAFSLKCNINKKNKFNSSLLREIVNDRIGLIPKK